MADLKPCPFCGGAPEIVRHADRRQSAIVDCTECGCRYEGTVVKYWNQRTPEREAMEQDHEAMEVERVRTLLVELAYGAMNAERRMAYPSATTDRLVDETLVAILGKEREP